MKSLAAISFATLFLSSASAQDSLSSRTARRDAGVYVEQGRNNNGSGPGLGLGVVYRGARRRDNFLWWKGGFGFNWQSTGTGASFSQAPGVPYLTPGDTIRIQDQRREETRYYGFGGLDVQREFYKGIFFFAGAEFRAGYGDGRIDSATTTTVYPVGGAPYATFGPQALWLKERRYFGEGLVSLGVRGYTRRMTAALEVVDGVRAAIADQDPGSGTLFDFNAGLRRYRISFGYRF